jgi:hypothetical protein
MERDRLTRSKAIRPVLAEVDPLVLRIAAGRSLKITERRVADWCNGPTGDAYRALGRNINA